MLSKLAVSLVVVLITAGTIATAVQDQDKDKAKSKDTVQQTNSKFMKRKLESARDIVGGLAMENYTQISKSAQDLMLLSHEAEWMVLKTPTYFKLSSEFRSSAQRLRDSAKEQNLDGATLAFFEVTLSCVRCHKYVRHDHGIGLK